MNNIEPVVARIAAYGRRRAVPIRETFALAPDPELTIAIATIRVVTENHVQAIAYGFPEVSPAMTARLLPMSRDTSDLEPFAEWLVDHVGRASGAGQPLRVWVPHLKTVETLEILGRRYERNPQASATLREAARYCRIVAEETRFAGQQTVAVARDLLLRHVVTGQMPIEDLHLGAVLAWVCPEPGREPRDVASERARCPASGILVNTPDRCDDDRIESLRNDLKGAPARHRSGIERQIRRILTDAVVCEWDLLVAARQALWGLALIRADADLFRDSADRVAWAVRNHLSSPRRAIPLTRKLDDYEDAMQRDDEAGLRSDATLRRSAARLGRVIEGLVARVEQPRRNRHPCHLLVRTSQSNLRVRADDRVALVGCSAIGIVREIRPAPSGTTTILIELSKGVRGAHAMAGQSQEWIESRAFPAFLRRQALAEADERATWMVTGAAPPSSHPTPILAGDLLDLAHVAAKR